MSKVLLTLCLLIALASFTFEPGASAQNNNGLVLSAPTAVGSYIFPPLRDRRRKKESVPEGGSAAAYLLLAGATCLGAIALQSRRQTA